MGAVNKVSILIIISSSIEKIFVNVVHLINKIHHSLILFEGHFQYSEYLHIFS